MARSVKITHRFDITKNPQKQGAWLLIADRECPPSRDENGNLVVRIEDLEAATQVSAWTTVSAAKRAAAHGVGRSRLTWSAPNTDDPTSRITATYEERLSQ